ncbi:MAG: hypothetical protein A2W31_16735 [Planctomycetes bacterium RBG_16_64_10]|nr:MAG: hypothetical protein A2W31_16735 [Planctomycetes bacterium RBG_16_64_10]
MQQPTAYQYVKLGMNLEYVRSIHSASILLGTSLVAFPHLMENLPGNRCSVERIIEVLRSLLIQLDEMGFTRTLAEAAAFRPMLARMEAYVSQTRDPAGTILQDHFADDLVDIAKRVTAVLKQELAAPTASPATP